CAVSDFGREMRVRPIAQVARGPAALPFPEDAAGYYRVRPCALAFKSCLHATHGGQGLWHANIRHQVNEALGHFFLAHACDINSGLDVAGQLRFYPTHGRECRHVQHLTAAQFNSFALVSTTEDCLYNPIRRARRELIQLLLPRRSAFWRLGIFDKLIALVLAQFHETLLFLFSFKSSAQRAIVAGNAHVSAELPAKHRQAKAKPLIHTARFRRPAPSSCTTLAPRRRPL